MRFNLELQDRIRQLYKISSSRGTLLIRVKNEFGWSHEKALEETEFLYRVDKPD